LAEQTYESLKTWIVRGDLEPGAALSENDLSRRFAISRSPLREAIRRLQDEGLLEASGPRGFSVPPLTVDYVRQVYGVRAALEVAAASSAPPLPAADIKLWDSKLEDISQALSNGDLGPFNESDFEFHDLFITRCGNPLLIRQTHRLHAHVQRILNYAGKFAAHTQTSFEEHLAIFEALRSGDHKAIASSVAEHIENVSTRLVNQLDEEPKAP